MHFKLFQIDIIIFSKFNNSFILLITNYINEFILTLIVTIYGIIRDLI